MKPDKSNHIAHSSLMICHYILTFCTKLCTFLINLAMSGLSCVTQDLTLWHVDSVVVVQGLSCLVACGILVPSLGSHPHPLHCKADSQPMGHEGSSYVYVFVNIFWQSQIELVYPPLRTSRLRGSRHGGEDKAGLPQVPTVPVCEEKDSKPCDEYMSWPAAQGLDFNLHSFLQPVPLCSEQPPQLNTVVLVLGPSKTHVIPSLYFLVPRA